MMKVLSPLPVLLCLAPPLQQEPSPTTEDEPAIAIEEKIDVVAMTPTSETGIDPQRFPASLYQMDAEALDGALSRDVATALEALAPGVYVNSVQNNALQPDLSYRGYSTSPLLGSAQGLSIWEDGVRVNEVFGDVVQWDLLPTLALERVELMAGAHAAFGPNTLGGALSVRTKSGGSASRLRLLAAGGSWQRREIGLERGSASERWNGYSAIEYVDENGWRSHSPSRAQRLFTKVGFAAGPTAWQLGLGWADNLLTGNGTAPTELIDIDRSAVFTYPDETDNDVFFPRLHWQRTVGGNSALELVGFLRDSDIATFNADERQVDSDEEISQGAPDAADNRSRTRQRGYGASLQLSSTHRLRGHDNLLTVGASWEGGEADFESSSELAFFTADRTTVPSGVFDPMASVAVDSSVDRRAIFVTESLRLDAHTTLVTQARYDGSSIRLRDRLGTELDGDHVFSRLNGSLGVSRALWPQRRHQLTVFAAANRSSRNPTPVELTCADPESPCRLPNAFVSDPPLDEVVTSSWEVGLRGRRRGVSWSAAVFDSRSDDDIIFVSSGRLTNAGHFENVARTRRRGLDTSLRVRHGRHSWFLAYTAIEATFGTDLTLPSANHRFAVDGEIQVPRGATIPGVPGGVVKAGATLSFDPFTIAALARAQASRFLRGDEANLLRPVDGYFAADLELSWRLRPSTSLGVAFSNVFDTEFETFGVLGDAEELLGPAFTNPRFLSPGEPRAVRLTLDFRPFDRD